MSSPLVTINLVVRNGEKYLRHCLDSVKNQTYQKIQLNILDNCSTDGTKEIIRSWKLINFIQNKVNLGMWGGQEEALKYTNGKYVVALSVDVLLAPDAIEKAVEVMERNPKIGALQAKIYQYGIRDLNFPDTALSVRSLHQRFRPLAVVGGFGMKSENYTSSQPCNPPPQRLQEQCLSNSIKIIDTVGFRVERSRRITNIGHGELDTGQFDPPAGGEIEIFGVEGAAPIFRRTALEDSKIMGEIADHDMWWYGDDIDLVWRMRLFDWKQFYSPKVIMYHDRSTTKGVSRGWKDYLKRIKDRRKIPSHKKRLDWRNKRLARLKNDYRQNVLHDLFPILKREIQELGYFVLFEPAVLLEIPNFLRLVPKMLKKRKEIMKKAKVGPKEIQKWFL